MTNPTSAPAGRDGLVNFGLVVLGIIAAVGVILRVAALVAAFITGHEQPTGGPFTWPIHVTDRVLF